MQRGHAQPNFGAVGTMVVAPLCRKTRGGEGGGQGDVTYKAPPPKGYCVASCYYFAPHPQRTDSESATSEKTLRCDARRHVLTSLITAHGFWEIPTTEVTTILQSSCTCSYVTPIAMPAKVVLALVTTTEP